MNARRIASLLRELADAFEQEEPKRKRRKHVAWGNVCEKPTWLYCVGISRTRVLRGIRTGGRATHRVTSGPRGPQLPTAHKSLRARTPVAFAEWLIDLAAQASSVARSA